MSEKIESCETETQATDALSVIPFLLGGIAAGAALGVLFAPKRGSELRADLGEWGRQKKVQGAELYDRVKHLLPKQDAVDAAKAAGKKVIREVQERVGGMEA